MKKRVWALLDNRMGSVGQIRGVAAALNPAHYKIEEKQIAYNRLAALPNILKGRTLVGVTPDSRKQISRDFPDLVISASRRTATVALWIKKQSPAVKIVQLLHPDVSPANMRRFDRIFMPEHDRHKNAAGNCFYTIGSPHRVSAAALAAAEKKWQKAFASLPRPLTAVIVGGSIKGKAFALDNARGLGRQIRALKERIGGSVLITDSKRTGSRAEALIMEELKGIPPILISGAVRMKIRLWAIGLWPTILSSPAIPFPWPVNPAVPASLSSSFAGMTGSRRNTAVLFSLSMIMATPCLCSRAAKNLNREKFCSPPLK